MIHRQQQGKSCSLYGQFQLKMTYKLIILYIQILLLDKDAPNAEKFERSVNNGDFSGGKKGSDGGPKKASNNKVNHLFSSVHFRSHFLSKTLAFSRKDRTVRLKRYLCGTPKSVPLAGRNSFRGGHRGKQE